MPVSCETQRAHTQRFARARGRAFVQSQQLVALAGTHPGLDRALNRTTTGVRLDERLKACYLASGNPDKVERVPSLLRKYAGDERSLRRKLHRKYPTTPACNIKDNAEAPTVSVGSSSSSSSSSPSVFYYDTSTYPNDVRAVVDELFFASWPPVDIVTTHSDGGGGKNERGAVAATAAATAAAGESFIVDGHATDAQHALVPRQAIQLVRRRLLAALAPTDVTTSGGSGSAVPYVGGLLLPNACFWLGGRLFDRLAVM